MSTNSTTQASGGGIGCLSVLGLIFIVLKMTGNIHWSWLWVLAPFWMPISALILFLIVVGLVAAFSGKRK